jgi:hypothetical protein
MWKLKPRSHRTNKITKIVQSIVFPVLVVSLRPAITQERNCAVTRTEVRYGSASWLPAAGLGVLEGLMQLFTRSGQAAAKRQGRLVSSPASFVLALSMMLSRGSVGFRRFVVVFSGHVVFIFWQVYVSY